MTLHYVYKIPILDATLNAYCVVKPRENSYKPRMLRNYAVHWPHFCRC